MRLIWTGCRVVFLAAFLLCSIAPAQRPGSGSHTGSSAPAGNTPGSVGSPGASPSTNYPGSTNFPGSASNPTSPNGWPSSRPIFLSGRVLFADGVKPNTDIRIERVCGGMPRLEAHTDSKGQFSFEIGQNAILDTDAADAMSGPPGRPVGGIGNPGQGTMGNGVNRNANWNCELRASYPGYRSDVVELANHRFLDDPNVGTIILHRLGSGETAGTISLTTSLVPKHAQKDYEKGVELAEKGKFEDAEKRFLAATATYPKYAIAWFALGELQQREGHTEAARRSYQSAIAADAKYASPYNQLALLSAQGQEWEAAANYSQQAIALDSVDFPSSLWYNALANFQLKKPEEAQKSIQELLRIDTAHRYPEAEHLYARMLLTQGNYDSAVTHLRAYLAIAPNGQGAAAAKELLGKLDQAKLDQAQLNQAKTAPSK